MIFYLIGGMLLGYIAAMFCYCSGESEYEDLVDGIIDILLSNIDDGNKLKQITALFLADAEEYENTIE